MGNLNYFQNLIVCMNCNKHFNIKRYPTYNSYICSGLKNYGKEFCDSKIIKEEMLMDIIQRHCDIYNKNFSIDKVKLFILAIKIYGNGNITINWKDGLVSSVSRYEVKF